MRISITAGSIRAEAELNDTRTAQQIWDALPFEISGSRESP